MAAGYRYAYGICRAGMSNFHRHDPGKVLGALPQRWGIFVQQ
jgi:hypothetical protein